MRGFQKISIRSARSYSPQLPMRSALFQSGCTNLRSTWRVFSTLKAEASSPKSSSTTSASTLSNVEDDTVQVTGSGLLPVTTKLEIVDTQAAPKWPVFRVMSSTGNMLQGAQAPELDTDTLLTMYKTMVRIQAMDDIFYNAQRQGRISFYMQNSGEEAIHVGSASALTNDDVIFAQYRELGVLLWRGFTLQQAADQCFSNESDLGKGRQMPVHYGSKALNFQTISSPLATQLPQAVGAAYALKLTKTEAVAVCFFGEGLRARATFTQH